MEKKPSPRKAAAKRRATAAEEETPHATEGVCPALTDKGPKKGKSAPKDGGKDPLEKIWSRRMALLGLKRIYETALEGARIEVRDEDGALVEVKFNPSAANAATKAIEIANRMMGYAAPEEDAADGLSLSVDLGEAEEFAV